MIQELFRRVRERSLTKAANLSSRAEMVLFKVTSGLRLMRERTCYVAEPEDIFIVSYPKSGTTLTQMIAYQLLTDGDMSIRHIDDFSPHLEETMVMFNQTLNNQKRPRVIKSHLSIRQIPKGVGRYIYVVRDGRDVAVSLWHWLGDAYPEFDGFFREFLDGSVSHGSWFTHVEEWEANAARLNLLVVRYEDLVSDIESSIRRIAKFLDVPLDESKLPRIIGNCTFETMKTHEEKFNLHGRIPPAPIMIRAGKAGGWRETLGKNALSAYDAALHVHAASTIFKSYGA